MSVSMHMVRAIASAVELAGGDRARFLARCRLAPPPSPGRDPWLPDADYIHVLETAVEITGDPLLGLHFGEQTSSVMFHLLAHLVEHSTTLEEALDMIVRYSGLLAQDYRPRILELDEHVALRFPWLSGDRVAVRALAELTMAGLLRLLQQYVRQPALAVGIAFAYPAPARAHADEYRRVLGDRARFKQPFTELQLPRTWLRLTQLHGNPELHQALQSHADRELVLQRDTKTSTRVQQLLAASDPGALPNMPAIARTLGMSARTLTRKLCSEGVTFDDLIVDRRRTAAQRLLELRVLSIREVADAMGFADAPAFHKAFKRWTGLTPLRYAATAKD